jgi:hypothetical protein
MNAMHQLTLPNFVHCTLPRYCTKDVSTYQNAPMILSEKRFLFLPRVMENV